jgi:hypothetical protein
MRIFAAHDAQGSIEYVVINPPDTPPATVKIEALLVTEVDASEIISGLDLSDRRVAVGNSLKSYNGSKTSELK